MSDEQRQSQQFGIFSIAPNCNVDGALTLDGRHTSLHVWSERYLHISSGTTVTGTMNDLKKVTLIKCSVTNESHLGKASGILYKYTLAPQIIVFGDRYFLDYNDDICEITFVVNDESALFHDTEAFGAIFNNAKLLKLVVSEDDPERKVPNSDWSWISYYTGKSNLFTSDTVIGRVSARHSPVFNFGITTEDKLKKKTLIGITFDQALTTGEALSRMGRVRQFVDLIIGRPQNVTDITLYTGYDHPSQFAQVYPGMYSENRYSKGQDCPSFLSILIDPVRESETFSNVLSAWLDRDDSRRTARTRISKYWGKNVHGYDRVIAAANVFDLLPSDVYAGNGALPQEVKEAIQAARELFLSLPESGERNDILGHLGRAGSWSLKKKISNRAKNICESIERLVPDLDTASDEAVNLRHFYVHGTPPRIDVNLQWQLLPFLTSSLEFIFFASDLMDAGWNISEWSRKNKLMGHPFDSYLVDYNDNMRKLKAALGQSP